MQKYIALLRGINVSGQKIIKMAELRELLESLDFSEVTTYIQSGNIIFKSTQESEEILQVMIKERILSHFGFDVPVLVRKREYLQMILDENPFARKLEEGVFEEKKMYYTLLSGIPDAQTMDQLEIYPAEGEEYFIESQYKVVFFYAANGYGRTKLNNNLFEKKMRCSATTRNLRTLTKLLELSLV